MVMTKKEVISLFNRKLAQIDSELKIDPISWADYLHGYKQAILDAKYIVNKLDKD